VARRAPHYDAQETNSFIDFLTGILPSKSHLVSVIVKVSMKQWFMNTFYVPQSTVNSKFYQVMSLRQEILPTSQIAITSVRLSDIKKGDDFKGKTLDCRSRFSRSIFLRYPCIKLMYTSLNICLLSSAPRAKKAFILFRIDHPVKRQLF